MSSWSLLSTCFHIRSYTRSSFSSRGVLGIISYDVQTIVKLGHSWGLLGYFLFVSLKVMTARVTPWRRRSSTTWAGRISGSVQPPPLENRISGHIFFKFEKPTGQLLTSQCPQSQHLKVAPPCPIILTLLLGVVFDITFCHFCQKVIYVAT